MVHVCTLMCPCFHRDEYFRMKVQWKSVSEEQEMRNSLLRGYRSLIGQLYLLSQFIDDKRQKRRD